MKFNIESPLFQFLTTLSEFILLNIIFLLSCLPLFTIGTSITALYYVTMQEARAEHGYIVRNYLKSWKQNFIQSSFVWVMQLILAYVFFTAILVYKSFDTITSNVIFFLIALASFILILCFLYVFPLFARFNNTIQRTVINSLLIAVTNIKTTILLLIVHAIYIYLCIIIPYSKIFMVLLGFSFFSYCNSYLFIRVFKKYEPTESFKKESKKESIN